MKKFPLPKIKPAEKIIVVVGLPATGKSYLTDRLIEEMIKPQPYRLFRTDDYIAHGFEKSLYVLMDVLKKDISPIKIIEGVQGYRLLRKGVELGTFSPDLVIICTATREVRQQRYVDRGKILNKGFDASLEKIWGDYMSLIEGFTIAKPLLPRFVIHDTLTGKSRHA